MTHVVDYDNVPAIQVKIHGQRFTPAHWGKRLGSLIIDQLIALPGYILFIIPGVLLFGFRDSLKSNGASIGRNVVHQRMVDINTGRTAAAGKKFSRNFVALLFRSLTWGGYALAELVVSLARQDGRCVTDLMFGVIIVEDMEDHQQGDSDGTPLRGAPDL